MSDTIYFIDPSWVGEREFRSDAVVEDYDQIRYAFDLARELWRLIDENVKADRIDTVMNDAFSEAHGVVLKDEDLAKLIELFSGLRGAVMRAGYVGENHYTPVDRMDEVRARTKRVDVGEYRGASAARGVFEAIEKVETLVDLLQRARMLKLHVMPYG